LNQIEDPIVLLYPMVGKEIINLDISRPGPTTKRNEICFGILAVLDEQPSKV
jgi:hypothetical protein